MALLLLGQIFAYLIGSIPFGYLIAKARSGIDIREHGSGNIGATNVGRVLGLKWFFVVFLLDFAKGAVPVAVAFTIQQWKGPDAALAPGRFGLPECVGLAAILGHLFPLYLGLKGGKGVATTIGVLLLLVPQATSIGLTTWVLFLVVTRMVSAASLAFALAFGVAYFLRSEAPLSLDALPRTGFVVLAVCLVWIRHLSNLGRILRGTEPKVRMPWQGRAVSPEEALEREPEAVTEPEAGTSGPLTPPVTEPPGPQA